MKVKYTGDASNVIYGAFVNYKSYYQNYQPQLSNLPITITCSGEKNYRATLFINYDSNNINASISIDGARYTVNNTDVNIYIINDTENYRFLIGVKYDGNITIEGDSVSYYVPRAKTNGSRIQLFNIINAENLWIKQSAAMWGVSTLTTEVKTSSFSGIVINTSTNYQDVVSTPFIVTGGSIFYTKQTNGPTLTYSDSKITATFTGNVAVSMVVFGV